MSSECDLLGLGGSDSAASSNPVPSQSSGGGQSLLDLLQATPASVSPIPSPVPASAAAAPSAASDVPDKVAVQFFAVGGAQQLNDKNGKKLALKFPSASRFAAVISKLRTHLPGDDNLFCFISCGDAQFAPSPDALIGDLYRTAKRPAVMVVSYCNKINYG